MRRVRTVTLDAYAHQDLPFEKLLEKVQPERDTSYSPLFQVALILQNFSEQTVELPGLKITPVASSSRVAKFDMNLIIEDGNIAGYEVNIEITFVLEDNA